MPDGSTKLKEEGQTFVEVELRLPNNKIIPFSQVNIAHVRSDIVESLTAGSTHRLTVRALTTDCVDNLIRFAQSQGTPRIRYRVGIGVPGNQTFLPWQEFILWRVGASLEGIGQSAGHFTVLELCDPLRTLSRATRTASRRGKISDIIARIAKGNGFNTTVIEPTVGDGKWIQSFEDDTSFIRDRLVKRAVNSSGRGAYNFYVQDNVLHFHTPDYHASVKDLVYYDSGKMSITQLDESQDALEIGASGVVITSYDPYTSEIKEVASDATKVLRFGNVIHGLDKVNGAQLNPVFHLSNNAPEEVQAMAQAMYETGRMNSLGLKIGLSRSLTYRVSDIVRVVISPQSAKLTPWSGTYLVTDAVYLIEGGALETTLVVRRGEFQTTTNTQTSLSVQGENIVITDNEAPGQDLNLKSIESSTLTHGAGSQTEASNFVRTQDRNVLPTKQS